MKIQTTPFSRSASRRPFGGKKAANPFGQHPNPMAASKRVKTGSAPKARASNPGACCAECAQGNPCNPDTCGTKANPGRVGNVMTVTPGRVGAQLAFNQSVRSWPWNWSSWNGWSSSSSRRH